MPEVTKKFQFRDGARTPETERLAEEIATHAVRDTWPEAVDIEVWWVSDNAGWLVYATGTIPEKEEGTT